MAQGLVVAYALYSIGDGFFIEDPAVIQGDLQVKAFLYQSPEYLQLDLAHDLHMDLATLVLQPQLGILFLQKSQFGQNQGGVTAFGKIDPIGHDAFQCEGLSLGLSTQTLTGIGGGKTGDSHQLPWENGVHRSEFISGVQPQLHGLFLQRVSFLVYITYLLPDFQVAAGDTKPAQAVALGVPGNLVYLSGKFRQGLCPGSKAVQNLQKFFDAVKLQGRAKTAGEELAGPDQLPDVAVGDGAGLQKAFQQGFVAECGVFLIGILLEIHTAGT